MKKITFLFSALIIFLIPLVVQANFVDVNPADTHYEAISYVYEQGIVEGYEGNLYKGEQSIIRAEFLAIVLRSIFEEAEIQACQDLPASDVVAGQWYTEITCKGYQEGLVRGYDTGLFGWDLNINFVEAAKIIAIAFDKTADISDEPWYRPFVEGLTEANAIPVQIQSFDQLLTRELMAEIIFRIHANITNLPSHSFDSLAGRTRITCHNDHCDEIDNETGEVIRTMMMTEDDTSASDENLDLGIELETGFCIDEGCNDVSVSLTEDEICFESNGIPNHETGEFPNSGNPNTIAQQEDSFCIPRDPIKTNMPTSVRVTGMALNGIFLEPGTAERDGDLNIEAFNMGLRDLGLDENNAHVQPDGSYHYHGIPTGLVTTLDSDQDVVLVAWAADGFPILYSASGAYASSYQLIDGRTGSYTQDYEYVEGSDQLDECNGTSINVETGFGSYDYAYFMTSNFPYIGRCVFGTPHDSVNSGPPEDNNQTPDQNNPQSGPPQEAVDACVDADDGDDCSFSGGSGTVNGVCGMSPDGLVCKP